MRSPIKATKVAWTDEELKEIDELASKTMERIAEQTGSYMSYESCVYAIKLAVIQRQVEDVTRKLATLAEMEGDFIKKVEEF